MKMLYLHSQKLISNLIYFTRLAKGAEVTHKVGRAK